MKALALQDLLTVNEAADLVRVSPWTVRRWLTKGKLPRRKAGQRTLIAQADLAKFVVVTGQPEQSSSEESTKRRKGRKVLQMPGGKGAA